MTIYTRTGDRGETSLFGGKRILKSSLRVDTYGTIDELNSVLGVGISFLPKQAAETKALLQAVQQDLFAIGAYLADPLADPVPMLAERVTMFEKTIDEQSATLPVLSHFILPGGGKAGAFLHQARTVCRRAERRLVALQQEETLDPLVVKYLNRLSDLLFSTARFVNYQEKKIETIWVSNG